MGGKGGIIEGMLIRMIKNVNMSLQNTATFIMQVHFSCNKVAM